jgi:hypothetical protein
MNCQSLIYRRTETCYGLTLKFILIINSISTNKYVQYVEPVSISLSQL